MSTIFANLFFQPGLDVDLIDIFYRNLPGIHRAPYNLIGGNLRLRDV